jgi:hypothetical protein
VKAPAALRLHNVVRNVIAREKLNLRPHAYQAIQFKAKVRQHDGIS